MNNTLFSFPKPENEPVLGYKPGSPERKEIRKALDELTRVVKPGGKIIIPTYINKQKSSSSKAVKFLEICSPTQVKFRT